MLIPLVDHLRCPRVHEDTWLVASIDQAVERDIVTGFLGCPKCEAEFPIRDGVVHFEPNIVRAPFIAPSEIEAVRIAAALDLMDPKMIAILHGECGAHAPLIRGVSPAALILVNPPEGIVSGDGVSIVLAARGPFANASMDGVAISGDADAGMVASLVASVRGGARVLGPRSHPIPPGLIELARDEEVWVAQLESGSVTSAPILPGRRPRTASQ
jgi:uncharacterized protein YbaR (Trm112 family)